MSDAGGPAFGVFRCILPFSGWPRPPRHSCGCRGTRWWVHLPFNLRYVSCADVFVWRGIDEMILKFLEAARAWTRKRGAGDTATPSRTALSSWRRLAPVLMLPVLAACTVDVAPSPTYPRPRPPGPPMCSMEYAPVCGERGDQRRTFGNACQARANGFFVVNRGECRREPVRPRPPITEPPPPPPRACTREYAPVCAERGNQTRTFSNACEARSGGFRVVSRGECRREPVVRPPVTEPRPPSRPQVGCSREIAPVCARRDGRLRTFGNACMARADGFRVVSEGRCD